MTLAAIPGSVLLAHGWGLQDGWAGEDLAVPWPSVGDGVMAGMVTSTSTSHGALAGLEGCEQVAQFSPFWIP